MLRQQPAHGKRDGPLLVGQSDAFALEVGIGLDARLGDQAEIALLKLGSDRDRVRTLHDGADQKRRSDVRDVDPALVESVENHLVRAAGHRNDDLHVQAFTRKQALALGYRDRQRKDAVGRGPVLTIAQRQRLCCGACARLAAVRTAARTRTENHRSSLVIAPIRTTSVARSGWRRNEAHLHTASDARFHATKRCV